MASRGEMKARSFLSASNAVSCPKPRRLGALNLSINDQICPSGCQIDSYETEMSGSKAGSDPLDIILSKGNDGADYGNQIPSSPPYFYGSPPSRTSNPLSQDSEFGNTAFFYPFTPPSPSSILASGTCFHTNIIHKPAAVRIEGFDCLNSDSRNCSISAMA